VQCGKEEYTEGVEGAQNDKEHKIYAAKRRWGLESAISRLRSASRD
jgi:hypothetical protein